MSIADAREVGDPTTDADRYASSRRAFERASRTLAGGVSSNFRAGGDPVPLFFQSGTGSHLTDLDGNDYVDYVLGMGPVILGHAASVVSDAVTAGGRSGQLFAGQTLAEVELAERVSQALPCAESVRFGSSGTEMVQAALRIARAATGRDVVVKFEGHYHGWLDPVLASVQPPLELAGPADRPTVHLPSLGQDPGIPDRLVVLPWNDPGAVRRLFGSEVSARVACVIAEPILCNTSVIAPIPGYLELLRDLTRSNGSVLIFDEVVAGFRIGYGGAQTLVGVTPDLAVLAKALGNGYPIAALAGAGRLMDLTNTGVLHGGTYNANVSSVAAANATLSVLASDDGAAYRHIESVGSELMDGLRDLARRKGSDLLVQGYPAVFNTSFGTGPVRNYRDNAATNRERQHRFLRALQDRGVRVTGRGTWFLSLAHGPADIAQTLEAADGALDAL